MKYRLKKRLPGCDIGAIFHKTEDGWFYRSLDTISQHELAFMANIVESDDEFFEPVHERIELIRSPYNADWAVIKRQNKSEEFTDDQIKKMEAAINGECWTEEEIRKAFYAVEMDNGIWSISYEVLVNNLKGKK